MNFRIILNDLHASIKTWYRSRGTLFWSLAFPILLILIFGAIFSGIGSEKYTLYVQDLDDSPMSHSFLENLSKTGIIEIKNISIDENITSYMEEHELKRVFLIPKGFEETVFASMANPNASVNLTLLLDPTEQTTNSVIQNILSNIIQSLNLGIAGGHNVISLAQESIVTESYDFIDFFLPGIIGMTIMTSSIYGSIGRNTKYREDGILRKLSTTPFTRGEWIFSKMLFMVFLSFISTAVILLVGITVYGVQVKIDPLMFVLIISASFAFSGLGMIIARFVKEEETADSAGGAITFPMMFLAGTFFPLEMMPEFLQTFAKFLPLYYVNEGLRDAMIYGDTQGALFNSLIILVFAVIVFCIGVVITSWKEK